MDKKSDLKTYFFLTLVMLFWGATFVSGRILAQNYHPFSIAFLRFSVASIFLVSTVLLKQGRLPKLSKIQCLKVFLLGLTGVFSYNFFFFKGLSLVQAGKASVIIACNPTITALLAPLFLKEEINFKKILGASLALIGALTVITKGNFQELFQSGLSLGELSLFGAVFSWVSYTLIGKIALKKLSPLEATTYACIVGALLLFPFAYKHNLIFMIKNASFIDWQNIFYLGFFATTLGFIWYYNGIRDIGAARASAFINFVPIFGVSSGMIFLDEKIHYSLIAGALLVITGVTLTNRSKKS